MWTIIKSCIASIAYCAVILFIGYAMALAAAPSALGLSIITAKSLLGFTALAAGVSGIAFGFMKNREEAVASC